MPSFVSNTVAFFNTAATWLAALTIPIVGCVVAYHALMKGAASEEMAVHQHARAIKNALVNGAIVFAASALTSVILSFFRS